MKTIKFEVNGQETSVTCPPSLPLLDVLRDELQLTGSKECCGKGECGSCTVLVNGEAVCSCLILAGQVENESVVTVEGIGQTTSMDPIQQAFCDEGATQCGYCTPGFIVMARSFLDSIDHVPAVDEVMKALSGNLCRCTGYTKIIKAVQTAAKKQSLKEIPN
ncbi:(2Fe-2S)-binding protein [Siminovitchia fortis]|uniref:(2Fe-2S)-binding protein n=1 Tax=Siminovitchia fortis TaxID=254758 RepID=A0A443IU63_9BACI|nr:(2Fe-2S)-binding protein [Siminovitchia fortis]RWR11647.1 (2Fe-2S)-binding protein [Siminovitchia fortis]WHY83225.1 (2Fe-2S)-binding protein [Siminovitchia fortis]